MKKILTTLLLLVLLGNTTITSAQKVLTKDERMEWWREARFGMFIHWGVYAQMAGVYRGHEQARGGAEWIMNRMKVPVAEYKAVARQFNPTKYDADAWVRMAKDAGMKYIIITAKHHDGFALFDSKASDWDVTDATPYGKDLLKPLAEACKKHGVKLGFYYSQAQDWGNPGGSVARKVMAEGWPNPDSARIDAYTKAHKGHWDHAQETATFDQYIDRVAVPQVKEILSNYGEIAVLWWDTPTNMTDEAALKLQEVLKLQPHIITNDRLKRPNFPGDTRTPEQKIPAQGDGSDWETCMTMNGTWGYRTSDNNWKSTETLIRNLVDIASKGGNYLLNVGPKPDGTFPQESIDRLKGVGEWMKVNSEAIYATKANPISSVNWGRVTMKPEAKETILYLTVFDWPKDGKLVVPGLDNKISSTSLLAGGKKLKATQSAEGTVIQLPAKAPDAIASVIKVQVKGQLAPQAPIAKDKMHTGELD
ncbi:alpha-L-fucosidase [Botryobacter ruber]|uniref:alpha-L-fucosidase n=1 Tax=Botryobacter ruber TaxID=2171629 RepID=UPI000E0BF597|nr:alpha-L-fucosidase [Botryobacter ruber]